ncbi:glutamate ABC transporter substrate-binding protein [Saccharothrix violaceirubra]|uniref:Polar amino acid transport system substrate-binding protein n=1 Tax=Saccharothrix violaceirubra TaxID=413306 RepID=A0A7W7T3F4_9PSEU|nr:glutamate ABC transporter substrate-binding protein [Saccharothrix violaceirubra]MBB4965863.1 polar amino acid transport system substrate-binding protein [Saccharothrix violaceirubra]
MRRLVPALALLACVACAPVPSGAPPIGDVSAVVPRPVDATELTGPLPSAVPNTPSAVPDPACAANPTASRRPTGPPPAPDAMPAGSTMATIRDKGRVVVGVDQNAYLMGFRDPVSGELEGFDIDMAREIAKALFGDPTRIQFRVVSSEQRIPALRQGDVDIVVRTMTINCDRWAQVDFSTVYYQADQRVLVPISSSAAGIDALGGKRVCASKGSSSLANIAAHPAKPIPVSVPYWSDCLVLLQQGQVDAISTDNPILAGLVAQDPFTRIVGEPFAAEPYGMAFPQGHEDFVRFVNAVLERLRADGTWASIHRRWLGAPPAPPTPSYRD